MTYYVFTEEQLQEALTEWCTQIMEGRRQPPILPRTAPASMNPRHDPAFSLVESFMHSNILLQRGMRKEPDL